MEIPWPPPIHSVARPRAPRAPIGGPRAMAPPFTLTRSQSQPSSRPTASDCAANASFASIRSISSSDRPDFARTVRGAGTGPIARERPSRPARDLRLRVRPQVLVLIDDERALPLLDLHRHDLLREHARLPGAACLLLALRREGVLVSARDLALLSDVLGGDAHV